MFKILIGFFLALLLTAMLGICKASSLEQVSNELYLCNYVWYQKDTTYWKVKWLVYFECFYTLDEVTITSEYKTLVVLSKDEMFVVSGWKR